MGYSPSEVDLNSLGFTPDSLRKPFINRIYTKKLPLGTVLQVRPTAHMQTALELTRTNAPLFLHHIESLEDLQESAAGRGDKDSLANPRPRNHG